VTRVVLDTVILVRAMINPKSICGEIVFDLAHRYELVVSPPVIFEYLDVLHRPRLSRKFLMVTGDEFPKVLKILSDAEVVEFEDSAPISRDRNDDKIISTAIAGGVKLIVTEDKDLLVLDGYEEISIVTSKFFHDFIIDKSDPQ
jgi:putative PIN family toxin of toxin-antitoxin system